MVQHSYNNLQKILIVFAIVFVIGMFVPFILAVYAGRVTPYAPYISDCGGNFPEAGVFSTCLVLIAILSQCIMILHYLVVEELNSTKVKDIYNFLNTSSLVLGSLATIAFIVVASFPTTTISQVHNTAAGIAAMCISLYMFCQSWISLKISREKTATKFRLAIMAFNCVAVALTAVFGVMGSARWTGDHWVGLKRPGDKGFLFYVISSSSEWVMAILYFFFHTTFIPEFKESTLQFRLLHSQKPMRKPGVAFIST